MSEELKKQPHKWAKEIKAWADGNVIQWYNERENIWEDDPSPCWNEVMKDCNLSETRYRIKPTPKPDLPVNVLLEFRNQWKNPNIYTSWNGYSIPAGQKHTERLQNLKHIRFIFDGETEELKDVEIIR